MKRVILFVPIALAACQPPATGLPPAAPGKCVVGDGESMAGRPYTAALGKRLLRATGARTMRVIRPGQMVTMDFREDRLDVRVDSAGRILSLSCG